MKISGVPFKIFAVLLLGFTLSSQAHAWTKFFDCTASNAVVDRETPVSGPEDFQIVFRDHKMIGQLPESGAVATKRMTSLNEIVLMIKENELRPREWIGEADAFSPSGVVYFVRPEETSITFEAYRTAQSSAQSYIILDKLGGWRLDGCQKQVLQLSAL